MLMELLNNPDMYVIIKSEDFIDFGFMVGSWAISAYLLADVGLFIIRKIKNKIKSRRETK